MIRAEAWTDDQRKRIRFDATPWFEQATQDQIEALIDCGFRGDYPADDVALYMAKEKNNQDAIDLFKYIELVQYQPNGETLGFECAVNEEDARAWLKNHPVKKKPKPSLDELST